MDCCNFDCPNKTARRRIRCGPCRRSSIRNCCVCGTDVATARPYMCKDCSSSIRHQFMIVAAMKYRAKMYAIVRKDKICKICKVQLPYHRQTYCSNLCRRKELRIKLRKIKYCEVCSKDLSFSRRQKTCSKECLTMYNKKYARDRWYKKGIVLGLSTF